MVPINFALMHKLSEQLKELASQLERDHNLQETEEQLSALLASLQAEKTAQAPEFENVHHLLKSISEPLLNNTYNQAQVLKTGFKDFDRYLTGLCKGDLLVIGGRPGMGKTQLMLHLAMKMAQLNGPIGFISLETGKEQLSLRMLSMLSKISPKRLLQGKFGANEVQAIANGVFEAYEMPLEVINPPYNSLYSLLETCRHLHKEKQPVAIFIDTIQNITHPLKRGNRENEIGIITRSLKSLARELNVLLVVSSHISRAAENRPGAQKFPQLSDLKDSGSIEQDADKVLLLYRAEYYGLEIDENAQPTKNRMDVFIAKNHLGATGRFELEISEGFLGFKDFSGPYKRTNIDPNRMGDLD